MSESHFADHSEYTVIIVYIFTLSRDCGVDITSVGTSMYSGTHTLSKVTHTLLVRSLILLRTHTRSVRTMTHTLTTLSFA